MAVAVAVAVVVVAVAVAVVDTTVVGVAHKLLPHAQIAVELNFYKLAHTNLSFHLDSDMVYYFYCYPKNVPCRLQCLRLYAVVVPVSYQQLLAVASYCHPYNLETYVAVIAWIGVADEGSAGRELMMMMTKVGVVDERDVDACIVGGLELRRTDGWEFDRCQAWKRLTFVHFPRCYCCYY